MKQNPTIIVLNAILLAAVLAVQAADAPKYSDKILTPPPPASPRINGPSRFGARPGSPFLYTIPATSERPMQFGAENLLPGLSVNSTNGQISGKLETNGHYDVVLTATNPAGQVRKEFCIVAGEAIALTPPMGWNSWNCWASAVDREKVLGSAKALVSSGLINQG